MQLHRWLHREGTATAARALDVRVAKLEARIHQRLGIVQFGTAQVEKALAVYQHLDLVTLEDAVPITRCINIHFVGQSRASPADYLHTQPMSLSLLLEKEIMNFLGRIFADFNRLLSHSRPSNHLSFSVSVHYSSRAIPLYGLQINAFLGHLIERR